MTRTKPTLGTMVKEGTSALRRYPGLVTSLYIAQFVMALLFGWAATRMLSAAFAQDPLFEQAVDGDLVALFFVTTDSPEVFKSIIWAGMATVVAYMLLSWYLVGGLNAVLIQRPGERRDVATTFGAGGAATFFAYARLGLLSLVPYVIILVALGFGVSRATESIRYALTVTDVAWALIPRLIPGLLLLWVQVTAVDYARIELSRERGLASWRALGRGYRMVLTDWRPLSHIVLYAGWFAAVSALFVAVTQGQAMPGAMGAITIFVIRQLVLIIRYTGAIVCAGGQVVYAVLRAESADQTTESAPAKPE